MGGMPGTGSAGAWPRPLPAAPEAAEQGLCRVRKAKHHAVRSNSAENSGMTLNRSATKP